MLKLGLMLLNFRKYISNDWSEDLIQLIPLKQIFYESINIKMPSINIKNLLSHVFYLFENLQTVTNLLSKTHTSSGHRQIHRNH